MTAQTAPSKLNANIRAICLFSALLFAAPATSHAQITRMPGLANEIGVSRNGAAFVIGTSPCIGSGCTVYAFRNANWQSLPGTATRVAADPAGNPWVINQQGNIFRYSGSSFVQQPGLASDIAIGADGSVFVIGTGPCNASGCTVYKFDGSRFIPYPGTGVRIAVDPSGNPWIVNSAKQIFRFSVDRFHAVAGAATDIAIGGDGSVHIVSTESCLSFGCMIYTLDATSWKSRNAHGLNIAAASREDIWVTNGLTEIYRIGQAALATVQFTALNYNVMLLSPAAFPNHQQSLRASLIPAAIQRWGTYDVVVFSEAFHTSSQSTLRSAMITAGYPYSTSVVSSSASIENGGVYIQSRWPIVSTATLVYTGCAGADCLSSKGASYARIAKSGKIFHVFGTHLQSERSPTNHQVRMHQLTQLANFVQQQASGAAARNEPVIILGDMNICDVQDAAYYRDMLARLNAEFNSRPAGWSFDTKQNTVAYYRYPTAASEWLDYVMPSRVGQMPTSTVYSTVKVRSLSQYNMYALGDPLGLIDGGTNHYDLSDHYALAATFHFR